MAIANRDMIVLGQLDSSRICGLFSFNLNTGDWRTLAAQDCNLGGKEAWNSLTMSRDASQVVVARAGIIERINVADGAITPIGTGSQPVLSPDGQTLSFVGSSGEMKLLNLGLPSEVRSMGVKSYRSRWSPDSRLLAFSEPCAWGSTLRVMDTKTGSAFTVKGCEDNGTFGWIDLRVTAPVR